MRQILIILMFIMPLFAEYQMRGRTQNPTADSTQRRESAQEQRRDSAKPTQRRTNTESTQRRNAESLQKRIDEEIDSKTADSIKRRESTQEQRRDSAKPTQDSTQKRQDSTPKRTNQSAESTSESKSRTKQKQTSKKSTQKPTPDESTKKLGYRNITISNINKQTLTGINFFIGAHFGIDIVSMEHITDTNGTKTSKKSSSGSASFGLRGGILSEEEYIGGRFYGEFSYLKIPKFNVLNIGLDLDLLFNYYRSENWKIGGFIGLGGGMNVAMLADKELQNAGKKALIAIGWINVGLVRFVYGPHSAEFNVRIQYITPTIYSLKDKATAITTTYKASSNTLLFSYAYDF